MKLKLLVAFFFSASLQAAIIYTDNGSTGCSTPSDTDYTVATRTCGSGAETVYDTILGGLAALTSADILNIRTGTYNETGISTASNDIADGATNFAGATVIQGYLSEAPIWAVTGSPTAVRLDSDQWVIFKDFIIDGIAITADSQLFQIRHNADNIRLDGMTLRNGGGDCLFTFSNDSGNVTNVEVIGDTLIHDCGLAPSAPRGVGIYWQVDNGLIDGVIVRDNLTTGIWCHKGDAASPAVSDNNIIRNSEIYDNAKTGLAVGACANSLFYNNIIRDNGQQGVTFGSSRGGDTTNKFYNNTIYNNGSAGIRGGIFGFTDDNEIINNIIDSNGNDGISIDANADATIVKFNLMGGIPGNREAVDDDGTNTVLQSNSEGDPLFVNAATNDFHLQESSPAVDAGITLPDFTLDADGLVRADEGLAWDKGVFELDATPPPPDPGCPPCGEGKNLWFSFDF